MSGTSGEVVGEGTIAAFKEHLDGYPRMEGIRTLSAYGFSLVRAAWSVQPWRAEGPVPVLYWSLSVWVSSGCSHSPKDVQVR